MIGNRSGFGAPFDWRMVVAVALWSLIGLTAVVLSCRALVGAFDARITAIVPGVTTGLATAGTLWARLLFLQSRQRSSASVPTGQRLAAGLLSLAPAALISWAVSVHASPVAWGVVTGILVLGLTFLLVEEGVRISAPAAQLVTPHEGNGETSEAYALDPPTTVIAHDVEPAVEPDVAQQMTRRREPDGTEWLEAVVTASLAPGERETVVHIPIHPVLPGAPDVECEPLDDSPVITTVTAAYPYGVRVEVKRTSDTGQGLSVPIGVQIHSSRSTVSVA